MSKHYTAIVRIMGVTKPAKLEPGTARGYQPTPDKSDEHKESTEVASFTIRADSIAELVLKAQAHLALVEDTDG